MTLRTRFDVDLDDFSSPFEDTFYSANQVTTLGDIHGHARRFLETLVREGVLDISLSDRKKIKAIYEESEDLAATDLGEFKLCLSRIKLKDPCPKVRLIGDDCADRGNDDLLTVLTFQRLRELKLDYESLASNHGVEFLKQYAYGIDGPLRMLYVGANSVFGRSLHGLRNDIANGLVSREEVESI